MEDVTIEELSGLTEGEEVVDIEGNSTGEIVVSDYDEEGNVIGWHKEPVKD